LSQNPSKTDSILSEIHDFQDELKLAGRPTNGLLLVSDGLLGYVLSLLREEQPICPQVTVEDWSELLAHLQYHWIIPLLYWKICHLSPELHPPKITVGRMREIFLANRALYLSMDRQLHVILNAFNREGIGTLIFRGPALAWTAYPDPAARPSADIDFLVRPDQYLKAAEVLDQLGYRSQSNRFEAFQTLFNADPFVHSDDSKRYLGLDLHWSLYQYRGMERDNGVEDYFQRSITVEVPTLKFETLDRVDALIHAAFHLILHHPDGMRLMWISDIAFLARNLVVPDEWEVLQKRASVLKLRLAVEKALKLAQMWNGLMIPEGYSDFTKWPTPEEAEKVELNYAIREQGPDIRLKGYLASIRSSPRKIRYLFKFLFPDPALIRITYPPSSRWLLPLSYIRRWGSWFVKVLQYGGYELKQLKKLKQFKGSRS